MFATITKLAYWKSEHDEQSCEDAFALAPAAGLFVVADGVGTAVFSNIWARIMVNHFLAVPLLSTDPFEVDWWLRPAQEQYKKQAPDPLTLPLMARKKAQEGSFTTLVALRLVEIDADTVSAQLLAFGDSCALVRRGTPGKDDLSFPLEKSGDFERGPVCLPSYLKRFDRMFTTCLSKRVIFAPGDQVMLATDAVAKWVIGGGGRGERFYADAFAQVAGQTAETWPDFIQARRDRGEMVDDDATAIVVTFCRDGAYGGETLDVTREHAPTIRAERQKAHDAAKAQADKELLAITFGDGADFGYKAASLPKEIAEARSVADALNEVRQALRSAINSPDLRAIVEPLWKKHQATLQPESCARELIESLHQMGIMTAAAVDQSGLEERLTPASVAHAERPSVGNRAADQQEGKRLLGEFLLACRQDDDHLIVAAYEAILRSPGRAAITLTAEDEARARRSQERLRSGDAPLLPQGTPQEMVTAAAAEPGIQSRLSPEEREQLRLARDFVDAWQNNDDVDIRRAYEAIRRSPCRAAFDLAPYEPRIQAAARPYVDLTYLQKALQLGKPLDIADQFHTLQITLDALPGTMRQEVEPTLAFARAYHDSSEQSHTDLLRAYEQLRQSGYGNRLHWDEHELQRLEQARQAVEGHNSPDSVLGWVNGYAITAAMAKTLDRWKDWYFSYRQRELGRKASNYPQHQDDIEAERKDLNEGVLKAEHSWDILIDDVLIQEGLKKEVSEVDIEGKVQAILSDFQSYLQEPRPQQGAGREQFETKDMQDVLRIFVRRRMFLRHQQTEKKFRAWLKHKRNQAVVQSDFFS